MSSDREAAVRALAAAMDGNGSPMESRPRLAGWMLDYLDANAEAKATVGAYCCEANHPHSAVMFMAGMQAQREKDATQPSPDGLLRTTLADVARWISLSGEPGADAVVASIERALAASPSGDRPQSEPKETTMLPFPTTDAMTWTAAFRETFPDANVDDGTMLGWFANAIEHGRGPQSEPSEPGSLRAAAIRAEEVLTWALRNSGGECPADYPTGYVKAMKALVTLRAALSTEGVTR